MINLHRLDLNLLRTLDVLLSENNVTRAAQRLNLSQPSVSIQLARLREMFADPLLMPGPRGMQPTARADELRQPLRAALAALEQAVAPVAPFNPAAAAETWRVAATDYMASATLMPMLGRLRQASPGSRLAVFELQPERLVRGQSGLVVVEPPLAVAGFEMLMLWHERWHRDTAHQWLRQFIVNSLEEQTC